MTMIMNYNSPSYWRILHTIDFHVPRRTRADSILKRERETVIPAEKNRWEQARLFSPFWFRYHTTCFLDDLDRIVLLSPDGMEERNAPIARIGPTIKDDTTVAFEDGDYHIITTWEVKPIPNIATHYLPHRRESLDLGDGSNGGINYHEKYPTATRALALRNLQIESCLYE